MTAVIANRLLLCAGNMRRDGWKTLDAVDGADFIATIPPLPDAVKAEQWNEIEWIHGITSLYPWDAETVLKELRQVLAPGAKLILEQPDFRKALQRVEWLFGDPDSRNPLHMNKWGWSPWTLSAAVHAAGFNNSRILPAIHHIPARDFRIEAYA